MIRDKLCYLQLAQAFDDLLSPSNLYYTFGACLPFALYIRVFLLAWICLLQVSQVSDLLSLFFLLPPDVHFVAQFLNFVWFCEPKIRMVLSYFWKCVFVDHFLTPGQLDSGRISCKVQNIDRTGCPKFKKEKIF